MDTIYQQIERRTAASNPCYSRRIPDRCDNGISLHIPPMATLYAINILIGLAAGAIMTRSEEWQTLAGLALGAAIGGVFGLLYTAFAKNAVKQPWQIMAWRGVMNLSGGIGFGSLAVLAEVKWWDLEPGPLLVFGTGFCTAWMAVGLAMTIEPRLIRLLEERGDIAVPPLKGEPIDLTYRRKPVEAPTTKLI